MRWNSAVLTACVLLASPVGSGFGPSFAWARAEASAGSPRGVFLRELAGLGEESTDAKVRLTPQQREALRTLQGQYAAAVKAYADAVAAAVKARAQVNENIKDAIDNRDAKVAEARKKLEEAQAERERVRKEMEASKPGSPEREALKAKRDAAVKETERLRAELQRLAGDEKAKIDAERAKKDGAGGPGGAGAGSAAMPDFADTRAKMLAALTDAQRDELQKRLARAEASMDAIFGDGWRTVPRGE